MSVVALPFMISGTLILLFFATVRLELSKARTRKVWMFFVGSVSAFFGVVGWTIVVLCQPTVYYEPLLLSPTIVQGAGGSTAHVIVYQGEDGHTVTMNVSHKTGLNPSQFQYVKVSVPKSGPYCGVWFVPGMLRDKVELISRPEFNRVEALKH
jgi:hypothetical protein